MSPRPGWGRVRPSDQVVTVDCVRCDTTMVVETSYGMYERVVEPCDGGCVGKYTDYERGVFDQAVSDACGMEYFNRRDDE